MSGLLDTVREAKSRLPLPGLLQKLGDGAHAHKSCRCPFHDDASNSFSVFQHPDGSWGWKCFAGCGGCGGGDEVDYLAKRYGLSKGDAMRRYCAEAGLSDAPAALREHEQAVDWQACVKALTPKLRAKVAAWRGVSVQTVDWWHRREAIGWMDGLIAFAVCDEQGKVLGCHCRRRDGTWRYKGTKLHPLVFGATRRAARVLVFESQWDGMAFTDVCGWHIGDVPADTAMVITRGAANGGIVAGRCSPGAVVYAFVQNDEPKADGSIPAEKWLRDVAERAGCKVLRVATPQPHKDLNDRVKAGATKEDIEAAMREAQPVEVGSVEAEGVNALEKFSDRRPKVQLPGDDRLLSAFAGEVGKILGATQKIFKRGGLAFILNDRSDGLALMTPDTLRTWIENHLVCFKIHKLAGTDAAIQFRRTITQADAAGILASPQFLEQLPQLERLNHVRVPVLRGNGEIVLLPAGYDIESKSLTLDSVEFPTTTPVVEAKRVLDDLFREFSFADAGRSLAVAVGAMLTVFGRGLLPRKSIRPCFIFVANAEGAGKTLLVKVVTVPVLGCAPVGTAPKDETEMQKMLLTAIMEARPVLFLDNFKRHVASESLEAFITAADYEGRILGQSKSFRGENDCVVFISGNGCTVSPDMRRRSLFSELFLEAERAEDRVFKNNLEVPALLQKRAEILSALWALVKDWDKAGRPRPSRGSSSFLDWSNIVGGIVEHAGFGCPLETPQIEAAVDTDGADMHSLVVAIAGATQAKSISFDELITVAREGGLFERVLPADGDLDARARSTLGKLFKRYDRRIVGGFRFTIEGKGHSRAFKVDRLDRVAGVEPGRETEQPAEPEPAPTEEELKI